MMNRIRFTFVLALPILFACSAESLPTEPATVTPEELSSAVEQSRPEEISETRDIDASENFDTANSVRTLMNAMVQPNATQLWQSVRYVVSATGIEEDISPQTDEDWSRLRASAISLIETGNALLLAGRAIDNTPLDPDYPAYQYQPEEIQVLRESNPEAWRFYVQEMQFSTQATLAAINKRDVLALIEKGAAINNACEGCHGEFWYRRVSE